MEKQSTTPIIRLNDAGALFLCEEAFVANIVEKQVIATINKGEYLLFLGASHFQSKRFLYQNRFRRTQRLGDVDGSKINLPEEIYRERLKEQLFRGPYYTSLNFLWKEKIVKVTWQERWGLDQLAEAAKFLYSHFSVPKELTGKVNK